MADIKVVDEIFEAMKQNDDQSAVRALVEKLIRRGKDDDIDMLLWAAQTADNQYWTEFAVRCGGHDRNDRCRYQIIEDKVIDTYVGCTSCAEAVARSKAVLGCTSIQEFERISKEVKIRFANR